MSSNTTKKPKIGFIGFGEVTYYISRGLIEEGIEDIFVYSRALEDERKDDELARGKKLGIKLSTSIDEVMNKANVIFSSIRGDAALDMAKKIAPLCNSNHLIVDLNNAIPFVKEKSADLIEDSGALFVDVGLLELPIQVEHKALMYASGKGASQFKELMTPYGMNIKYLGEIPGKAAKIKAIANIYMKGIQGICLEFALSAHKADIDLDLLQPLLIKPLENLERIDDVPFWIIRGSLLASRKKAEMQEAVKMLKEIDIEPVMLEAAIERLKRISEFKLNEHFEADILPQDYKKIIGKMMDLSIEKDIVVS